MAKNSLLMFLALSAGLFLPAQSVSAQTWKLNDAHGLNFSSIASSADGTKLAAIDEINAFFSSTNSGNTWTSNTVPGVYFFNTIVSSADGTKLVALALGNNPGVNLYTSTNAGVDWVSNNVPSTNLVAIASSADGNKLAAAAGATPTTSPGTVLAGSIFTTTNAGATWQPSGAPNNIWSCIASSADGSTLAAGTLSLDLDNEPAPGYLYLSTNSGTTWAPMNAPTDRWSSLACSVDGTKFIAAGRSIYTSSDSGTTWASNNVPLAIWTGVASSADGNKLVAVGQGIPVYTSTNSGMSWLSNNVPSNVWTGVASSADGAKLAATANFFSSSPGIYTSDFIQQPQLNIASLETNIGISWIVPSENFVLQENSDLTATNWTTVTNQPVLNLSNLLEQVVLPSFGKRDFYRLATP